MRLPIMQQRLSDAATRAAGKLDAMDKLMPEAKPKVDFATYMQKARAVAQRNPDFRAKLDAALRQYSAIRGG